MLWKCDGKESAEREDNWEESHEENLLWVGQGGGVKMMPWEAEKELSER